MQIPDKWREYQCQDYFDSALPFEGSWDEHSQVWTIELLEGIEEDTKAEFLQVGRPGVDDTGFGYRKSQQGFWAMYRGAGTGEFKYLAATIQEFLDGWYAGAISI